LDDAHENRRVIFLQRLVFRTSDAFEEEFSVGNAQEQQCDFFNFAMMTKCLIKERVREPNFGLEEYSTPTC
jgi:hypothetical protein